MIALLTVFLAMATKDVFSNASVFLVSRRHGLLAGFADGLSDIGAALSYGVTGYLTVDKGLTWMTVLCFAALVLGSMVGGVLGTRLGSSVAERLGEDEEADDGQDREEPVEPAPAR